MAVHIINLRSPQDGNGIAQNPYVQPALPSSAPLILLIHGYNVSLNDARKSYAPLPQPQLRPESGKQSAAECVGCVR